MSNECKCGHAEKFHHDGTGIWTKGCNQPLGLELGCSCESFTPKAAAASAMDVEAALNFLARYNEFDEREAEYIAKDMAAFSAEENAALVKENEELKAERDALMVQIETSYCETCAEREGVFKEETAEPDSIESGVTGGQCCSRPGRGHSFDCPIADVPEDTMGRE